MWILPASLLTLVAVTYALAHLAGRFFVYFWEKQVNYPSSRIWRW